MNKWSEREIRRQGEQQRLDVLLGNEGKNKLGQFATPPSLAIEIMQHLWKLWRKPEETVRFLEPALGTGAFYSALRQVFPDEAINKSLGIEIDPNYTQAAMSTWRGSGIEIVRGDFTRQKLPSREGRFNLIATNPPYVRHHHLGLGDKSRLKRRVLGEVGLSISGLAGLYCYFLLLADQWLAEGGGLLPKNWSRCYESL
jgi:methylase of polypeptide subunit release factors